MRPRKIGWLFAGLLLVGAVGVSVCYACSFGCFFTCEFYQYPNSYRTIGPVTWTGWTDDTRIVPGYPVPAGASRGPYQDGLMHYMILDSIPLAGDCTGYEGEFDDVYDSSSELFQACGQFQSQDADGYVTYPNWNYTCS